MQDYNLVQTKAAKLAGNGRVAPSVDPRLYYEHPDVFRMLVNNDYISCGFEERIGR
jgi:hypothetical protein